MPKITGKLQGFDRKTDGDGKEYANVVVNSRELTCFDGEVIDELEISQGEMVRVEYDDKPTRVNQNIAYRVVKSVKTPYSG